MMTDREKRAFEDAEQQIKDCNLSFAYIQGMQHCLDIFRHHLEYEDTAERTKRNDIGIRNKIAYR